MKVMRLEPVSSVKRNFLFNNGIIKDKTYMAQNVKPQVRRGKSEKFQ
jgi:hypothetical protein